MSNNKPICQTTKKARYTKTPDTQTPQYVNNSGCQELNTSKAQYSNKKKRCQHTQYINKSNISKPQETKRSNTQDIKTLNTSKKLEMSRPQDNKKHNIANK